MGGSLCYGQLLKEENKLFGIRIKDDMRGLMRRIFCRMDLTIENAPTRQGGRLVGRGLFCRLLFKDHESLTIKLESLTDLIGKLD